MVRVLGIETSRQRCSAALLGDGTVREDTRKMARAHDEHILGLVDGLVAAAGVAPQDLDGIAFGCGPGSFTGVRIAASVAQALALGAGASVAPVSSTRALAVAAIEQRAVEDGVVVSIR
ncbi:MAG: tRNA (adenosine(37)-N6)-threonylcarbamoyltransferase complex dimerization subunit type 1 TsaB, partial [Gammaproteobacteria bacterium]|nr:tRNA (adenosine(37)-N6)-threonylcarbamoyltransferase complex dimerization subunit type 1 TsaB [Gammaproteobacteria bacterium]